jgi:hypothetical protein
LWIDEVRSLTIIGKTHSLKAIRMTDDDEPNIVISGKSRAVAIDGHSFMIEIYRLEADQAWTLEVTDQDGASHVWQEQFLSDKAAYNTAVEAIETEGAIAFMRGNNIIPFRQP